MEPIQLGQRLKYARDRAGLTLAQVKERTGIGESSISEFENDKREPSVSQLNAMGQCYRRSVAFFLSREPLPNETVLWRQRPGDQAQQRQLEMEFLSLCERYHNLEVWTERKTVAMLPSAEGTPETFRFAQAEELARTVRRDLALGDHPALALLQQLEEACGLKVFHLAFEPSGTAACAMSPTFGAAVLLNAKNVRWRRNFDLAHELFHLLTWNVFKPSTAGDRQPAADEEKLADCFAANLLMPDEAMKSAVTARSTGGQLALDAVFDMARQFDVSVEALLWRLHWLYRSSGQRAQTEQHIKRACACARLYEEREHTEPPVRPARFDALAVSALRRGEIAIGRFAEYMGISRRAAMEYIEQESVGDEAIELAPA